jgi:hypothetical protein
MVKRYDLVDTGPEWQRYGVMQEHPIGDYVDYQDYKQLEDRVKQMEVDLQEAQDEINYLRNRYT